MAPQNNLTWIEKAVLWLVAYSVAMFFLEMGLGTENSLAGPKFFLWSERVTAGILTLEVFLRFYFHATPHEGEFEKHMVGSERDYTRSPEMWFDLLAVVPFWVGFFTPVEFLAAVRSMRILRLLKFYRASPAAHLVMERLIEQGSKISLVLSFSSVIVLFAGVVMHLVEGPSRPEVYGSLLNSIWWAVITFSTIGYGDIYPATPAGKIITIFMIPAGLSVVGALIGIMSNAFADKEQG